MRSLQQVKQKLLDRILDKHGVTSDQANKIADIFEHCLINALKTLPEYTHNVILSKMDEIERRLAVLEAGQKGPKTIGDILLPLNFTYELHATSNFYGRRWLLEKVKAWLGDPQGAPLFWLTAEPGVGKTAFAAWLTGQLKVAAVHFCNAGISDKNDPVRLVGSLAYQLSQRLGDGYSEYLQGQKNKELQKDDPGALFDCLLVQPLAGGDFAPPPEEQPLLILIDGLDEAVDPQTGNRVAQLLGKQAGRLPPWLRILITSRAHTRVMEWLQGTQPVELPKAGN